MTDVLSTRVDVFEGFTEFSAKPGLITLTDDDRVTIATIDPNTGRTLETVMDAALTDLNVRSVASNVTFTADRVKKTVGFSFGARSVRIFGLLGVLIGQVLSSRSGQAEWIAELKRRGVAVSGSGGLSRRAATTLLVLLVVVLVVLFVLASRFGR